MFRSFAFAIGIFLLILGAQTLVVSKWILSYEANSTTASSQLASVYPNTFRTVGYRSNQTEYYQPSGYSVKPIYQTQEWMPWSLLAGGAIIVLYTYSISAPKP